MGGLVTAYDDTSLTIDVSETGGSGTAADWNINLAGEPGEGDMHAANNLSDVESLFLARSNLGVAPMGTRSDLKALDTTAVRNAFLAEAGREGWFAWKAGNYSTQIANDPREGVYIKATAISASAGSLGTRAHRWRI